MRLPVSRGPEPEVTVETLEGFGPRAEPHVDLEASLGGEHGERRRIKKPGRAET